MRRTALVAAAILAVIGVVAACKEGPRDSGGGYTATPNPSASPNSTPMPIAVGTSASGAILTPGRVDLWVASIASAGEFSVDIDAQQLAVTNRLDARIAVFSPAGVQVGSADDGTTVAAGNPRDMRDPFLVFTAAAAGDYTISVEDSTGAGGPTDYNYRLRVAKVTPMPYATTSSCGSAVLLTNLNVSLSGNTALGTPAPADNCCGPVVLGCTGSIVSGNDAIYKVVMTANESFQAVRTGAAFDGAVYVASDCTSATQIQTTCIRGGDGRDDADGVVFKAPSAGTYYLFVDGVPNGGATSGPYQLHLKTF